MIAPGYNAVGMAQLSGYIRRMAVARDGNTRAKLAAHALLLVSDADKAFGQIGVIVRDAQKYDELLGLMVSMGVTIPNPDEPISLPEEEGV